MSAGHDDDPYGAPDRRQRRRPRHMINLVSLNLFDIEQGDQEMEPRTC